jgi:fumarate reductase flavoprotein subunit
MRDRERHHDVIVVGGGGAGMSAALAASDAGARVALLEADEHLGGTTARSSGVYYAAGTPVQRERGIADDSADAAYHYYVTVNQCRVEPALVRTLCDEAAAGLHWLQSLGVRFPPEDLYLSCIGTVPRGHKALGFGAAIAAALERAVRARPGIDVVLNARVDRLTFDAETGKIDGIETAARRFRAPCVVLTAGGLGHDHAMLQQYYPDALVRPDWQWAISAPCCNGDAIRLGKQVAAATQGANSGVLSITANFEKKLESGGRQGWAVYVNREGRRFVNELLVDYFKSRVLQAQTDRVCFAVFDDATRRAMKPQPPREYSPFLFADNWTGEKLAALADQGRIVRRDSLEALAEACGLLNRKALVNTVSRYNADVARGRDGLFFKDPAALRPVSTPPFYAVELRAAVTAVPHAGVRIDDQARVISEEESVIPGLFAAGASAGNVMGDQYVGGGISISNAVVFGRIAGRNAVRDAASRGTPR